MHRQRPDAPGARDALAAPCQHTYRSQRKTHRQCEFGRSLPRHRTSRRRSPQHLLTGWSVAGHFPSGRTVSGHFLLDAACQGIFLLDTPCQGIFLLDALCQGIFLLEAAVSEHFPTGQVRTTHVMAPWSRWLSRCRTSQQILLKSHSQTRSGFQA